MERAKKIPQSARLTFVITNNHFHGKAVTNALQLLHRLTGKPVRVRAPLLHQYPELEPISSPAGTTPLPFPTDR
ncbi:hypothetical protein MYX77_06455 [Acidobacteriia bacterium AH_259_A11_L15]|nr:hypothetical protein [Acidobacteriia bacterium AH_259_A11_L15]